MGFPVIELKVYWTTWSRKVCRYEDKVSKHWPEFGQNGKEEVTIADVLRHEAGLPTLSEKINIQDCWKENIGNNRVGGVIEREAMRFTDPSKRWRSWMSSLIELMRPDQAGVPRHNKRVHHSGSVPENWTLKAQCWNLPEDGGFRSSRLKHQYRSWWGDTEEDKNSG